MSRYLMNCSCGNTVPVETRQAGGQVVCRCGAALDIPTLRHLRELPAETSDQTVAGRDWHARHGGVAALIIAAVLLAATGLWMHLTEPKPPKFDTAGREKMLADDIESVTPSLAWQWWINNQAQLDQGFEVYTFHLPPGEEQKLTQKRLVKNVLLSLAGVALVGTVAVAFWPTGQASRRRET